MAKKGMAFDCPKRGHKPINNGPPDVVLIEGYPHITRICRFCKGLYFEQLSDEKVMLSDLVAPDGKHLQVKVDE